MGKDKENKTNCYIIIKLIYDYELNLYPIFPKKTLIKKNNFTGRYKEVNGKMYVEVIYTKFFWKKYTVWVSEDHFYFETTSEEKIYNCRVKVK